MPQATHINHKFRTVNGVEIFFREAGDPHAPAIVLLSGHPSGVHAYDGLIERLGASWHAIAPDYPGYGFSATPVDAPWTFDWLADVTNAFLEHFGLENYVLYMFDFGARSVSASRRPIPSAWPAS